MVFILILPVCLFRHSSVCCTLPSRTVRGCYSQNVRLLHTLQTETFNLHQVAVWILLEVRYVRGGVIVSGDFWILKIYIWTQQRTNTPQCLFKGSAHQIQIWMLSIKATALTTKRSFPLVPWLAGSLRGLGLLNAWYNCSRWKLYRTLIHLIFFLGVIALFKHRRI